MLSKRLQTSVLTLVALVAFAGNSVLCRIALKDQTIDPASFTFIRIAGGAVFLVIL
ncbi:MAG: EamA family transporter, partial [Thalassolituus sp.]